MDLKIIMECVFLMSGAQKVNFWENGATAKTVSTDVPNAKTPTNVKCAHQE